MTQFGRSLHALNIDILCANTPQAKGRVEREISIRSGYDVWRCGSVWYLKAVADHGSFTGTAAALHVSG
jgi:hypothetical protein